MAKVLDFFRRKRFNNFLTKLENKKLQFVDESICSVRDLMLKDENGNLLIEYFVKFDVILSNSLKEKFLSIPENLYYIIDRPSLYGLFDNLKVSYDILFSTVNGKLLIEHLSDKRVFFDMDFSSIDNINFIDYLVSKNLPIYPYNVNHKMFDRLLENNMLDKYVKNVDAFKWIVSNIHNVKIYDYIKNNNLSSSYLSFLNKNVLMQNVNGVTLYDKLENEVDEFYVDTHIPADKDFINLLIKKGKFDSLVKEREKIMLVEIEPGLTLLEYLINNNKINRLDFPISDIRILDILCKTDRMDLCSVIFKECYRKLSDNFTKKTILPELYKYCNRNIFYWISRLSSEDIKMLLDMKEYRLLSNFVDNYMDVLPNGKYLIDVLLENNCNVKVSGIGYNVQLLNHLMELKKYDLVAEFPVERLVKKYDKYTYLEHIIVAFKNGELKYNINRIFNEYSIQSNVLFYYHMANYGLGDYFFDSFKKQLLNNVTFEGSKKTLLDHMMKLDPSLTVDNYISDDMLSVDVMTILNKHGWYLDRKADIGLSDEQSFDYNIHYFSNDLLTQGPILEEGSILLNQLYELFKNDGNSDPELVEIFYETYNECLIHNYDVALEELKSLINIKMEYPDFSIIKGEQSAYYSSRNVITLSDASHATMKHEIGHAIHDMQTNYSCPANIDKLMDDVINDKSKRGKISAFYKKIRKIKNDFYNSASLEWDELQEEYFTDEVIANIEKFLIESKEKKREDLKKLNVNDIAINIILGINYTFARYKENLKENFISNKAEIAMEVHCSEYMAIFDILDAIHYGELHSGTFLDANGKKMASMPGHGRVYYSYNANRFIEIVADYASIAKGPNCVSDLNLLRDLIGDELYFAIEDYYYKNIANSEILIKDEVSWNI